MANNDSAFGLKPVGKVGQNADNQGMSEYQIADNEASSIFQGDPVIPQASNTGFIDVAAAGDALLGVFWGVNYTDPTTGKPTFRTTIHKQISLLVILTLSYMTIHTRDLKYRETVLQQELIYLK